MATTVTRSVVVRRAVADVAATATDVLTVLPIMGGLGRFRQITEDPTGLGEWDVYLDVGSVHVGGRVEVSKPDATSMRWDSVRGTRNDFVLEVAPDPEGTLITMSLTLSLAGAVTGRLTELLTRGVVGRHLDAGLEQLRHHLTYGG